MHGTGVKIIVEMIRLNKIT
jgi:hypothetical protein